MNVSSGMVAAYAVSGAVPTPWGKMCLNPPIKPVPGPKHKLKKSSRHSTSMIAFMAKLCIMVLSTFLRRTSPP